MSDSPNRSALELFGLWCIEEMRGGFDVGVSWYHRRLLRQCYQDKAEELCLLIRVTATEACGENCKCAEYDDFPQECLRLNKELVR
jgi:hypothetical protein